MNLVVPAVLPYSYKELKERLALFAKISSINRVQIDVVDGKFASPASWPFTVPEELQNMVARGEMLPHLGHFDYEIDLMCFDAEEAAEAWLALGATCLIFHAESVIDLPHLLASARERYGHFISFGIALNIASDLALIELCLGEIEFVQFMGIARIGRQGQPFDRRVLEKVRAFRIRHPDIPVHVDGGISLDNAKELVALGISSLVIGSGILRAPSADGPAAAIAAFETLM